LNEVRKRAGRDKISLIVIENEADYYFNSVANAQRNMKRQILPQDQALSPYCGLPDSIPISRIGKMSVSAVLIWRMPAIVSIVTAVSLMACGNGNSALDGDSAPSILPTGGSYSISGSAGLSSTAGTYSTGSSGSGQRANTSNNGGGGAGKSGSSATGGAAANDGTNGAVTSAADGGDPETTPLGYGKDTTGGGSAIPIDAATLAEMQSAIDDYSGSGGLVIKYTGKFDFSSITDPCVQHTLPEQILEIKKKSDITILGADGSAANFGIHIASSSSNIIIRNMVIGLLPGGSASDMISVEGMSGGFPTNIWIDHNELFSSTTDCAGAGDTAFDGMIDIKKGADKVTISYNYFHDHQKGCLNGFTDSDDATRHVTFHHNLFENIGSRTPLQRHGYSHMLNNYLLKITTSGINVRMNGYALVEANFFENVHNPVTARDSSEIGYWELRNNNLATQADVSAGNKFGITWGSGDDGTVNATDWTTTAAFPEALGYSYTADSFQCVHDGLRAVVGAGKSLATLKCK
jgi:pectate lyase